MNVSILRLQARKCTEDLKIDIMKIRVQIDGYINVDDVVTEEQVREAVMFQLGWGGMSVDNPIGEPDWDDIDVDVEF